MKLTKKQKEEVDFLCKEWKVTPTNDEITEYINVTVHGKGSGQVMGMAEGTKNKLLQAKRRLDINVKMWTEDLARGLLGYRELIEDFDHPYATKVVRGIMAGLKPIMEEPRYPTMIATNLFDYHNETL